MSVLLNASVRERWLLPNTAVVNAANENFSETMLQSMSLHNTLRLLRSRPEGFLTRRTALRTVTYIPFGLVLLRTSRNQLIFGHYASNKLVSSSSFGMGRINFFFHQLASSAWIEQSNGRRFAVHMIFQDPAAVGNWGTAIRTDFGTRGPNVPDNAIPPVSMDTPATFPYNMFVLPGDRADVTPRTSAILMKEAGESAVAFASRLKQATMAAVPQNTDSGNPTDLRLVNLFLVVVESQRGGGGPRGPYWLTAEPAEDRWIINPRAIVSPARHAKPLCFWECVMMCLCMRQEKEDTYTDHYDLWMREMCIPKATARLREQQMKRIQYNCLSFLEMCRQRGMEVTEEAVSVDRVEELGMQFGFLSCAVVDEQGEVLVGSADDLYKRSGSSNHLVLLYHQEHFSVVTSYTALVPVKECEACGMRFTTAKTLEKHLEMKGCLKCECQTHMKEHVTPFQSVAEWRHHRANLGTECLFRTQRQLVVKRKSERERNSLRFPHDKDSKKSYGRWVRSDEFDAMVEEDLSDVRQYKEALYVDLESVVPMNGSDVKGHEIRYHAAYAIGWLRRSEAVLGGQPTLVYGMDCLEHFFRMLDGWWEELLEDETALWQKRCREGLVLEPVPTTIRGKHNYAARVQVSWRKLVEGGCTTCPVCGGAVHGDWNQQCAIQYWSRNVALKNLHEDFNKNAPRITVWAHNGGRYDWLFVHRYLMERNLLGMTRVVRGGGKYYELAYRGVFLFRDSLNFVMGSLERLGKDFNVETLKGIFPYRYLQDCSHIYDVLRGEEQVRRELPPNLFDVSESVGGAMGLTKKRGFTEEEYVEFMTQRGWVYDVKQETELYLAADIVCLYQVLESFRDGWKQLPYEPELFKFCTIGQMCHTYFLSHFLPARCYPTLDVVEDEFIRNALYGGRTEVFQRCIEEALPIHYVDVNSLYPHVMESCNLPSGDPEWHFVVEDPRFALFRASAYDVRLCGDTEEDMVGIMIRLNACDSRLYGFFEVDVVCKPDMTFPVLPERKEGKNMFTNETKRRMVYYSEELKFAIERKAAVVTRVHAWCQWTPQRVYGELVGVLKAEKMRGEGKDVEGRPIPGATKNPSLRAAAKTAQNALYGKSIQFINESVQVVDNQEDLYKLIRSADSDVTIEPIFRGAENDVVEVTVRPHRARVQRRSCSAIGTAILAEARMVLYRYFEEVQHVDGKILYCDTDSIVFAGSEGLPERCLSDAVYGKMKVEIPPEDIVPGGFVALAPKCYAFQLVDGSPYVKCKGVNLAKNVNVSSEDGFEELVELMEADEVLERLTDDTEDAVMGLSFEHLKMMVRGEKKKMVTTQMQFLKTKDRHVAAVDTVKLVTDQFDKRHVVKGGKTFAWNDYNRDLAVKVKGRDVGAVSNFFMHCDAEEIHAAVEEFRGDEWFRAMYHAWLESYDASSLYYSSLFLE